MIQYSLQKIFEYVNSITVTDDIEITNMNDSEGDKVKLFNIIDGDITKKEDSLNAFEEEIENSINEYTRDSINSLAKKSRKHWISDFPAQVLLIANPFNCAKQISNLKGQKHHSLKVLHAKFIGQLDELTALVRQPISHLLRQVVS